MEYNKLVQPIIESLTKIILDKEKEILLTLTCLLAQGHLLIEDIPGTGKTTLVKGLSKVLDLDFKRIQCTNDLLPGDILGTYVFDSRESRFYFSPGPIFSNIVLIDEINRATPKTQSGLLEAMAEKQVTLEGKIHKLPVPFFLVATQNPMEEVGTYPLPESQLDRFMFKISLGYPSKEAEKRLLKERDREELLKEIRPVISKGKVLSLQKDIEKVYISDPIYDYIEDLVDMTRYSNLFLWGLSPRASFMLLKGAKSWAFIQKRNFVLPEDVKEIFMWISSHRLRPRDTDKDTTQLIKQTIESVPIR